MNKDKGLLPVEIRQVRPCSVCAFFVHVSDTQEGRCTLNKGEKKRFHGSRWSVEEGDRLASWPCWYNITPEELETTNDPWIKSIVNESLRFFNSAHDRRDIIGSRRNTGRRR